jgi:hypothetical protein
VRRGEGRFRQVGHPVGREQPPFTHHGVRSPPSGSAAVASLPRDRPEMGEPDRFCCNTAFRTVGYAHVNISRAQIWPLVRRATQTVAPSFGRRRFADSVLVR